MFLGIEIGGTKLQLGVGRGDGTPLETLQRLDVDRRQGAEGIRRQIAEVGRRLIARTASGPSASVSAGRSMRPRERP